MSYFAHGYTHDNPPICKHKDTSYMHVFNFNMCVFNVNASLGKLRELEAKT